MNLTSHQLITRSRQTGLSKYIIHNSTSFAHKVQNIQNIKPNIPQNNPSSFTSRNRTVPRPSNQSPKKTQDKKLIPKSNNVFLKTHQNCLYYINGNPN